MPTRKLSLQSRNYNYCDIPACDQRKENLDQYDRLVIAQPFDQKLSCGCLAFEWRSHLKNCKFYNKNEEQPYYSGCMS